MIRTLSIKSDISFLVLVVLLILHNKKLPNGIVLCYPPANLNMNDLIAKNEEDYIEKATKFMFTASNISSSDIRMVITFFRFKKTPKSPNVNKIEPSTR